MEENKVTACLQIVVLEFHCWNNSIFVQRRKIDVLSLLDVNYFYGSEMHF